MKFLKFSIGALCIVLLANVSLAQNGKALSLDECMEIALKNNSSLKRAVYELDRSGANVMGSYSTILPRISTTLQSGRVITDRSTFINNEFINTSRNFHSFGANFGMTLFDFGRNWNTIKSAKSAFNARSQSLTGARQGVYSLVKQQYLELLKARNLQQEFNQAVERSKEQLSRTQSMYEIGSVALIDVYRQEVILGTDEVNLINQINIVQIAKTNLSVAMGQDPETPVEIMEVEPSTEPIKYSLGEAFAIAKKNNPQLRQFEYDMKTAEYSKKVAKASFWPSIGVGGSYSNSGQNFNNAYGTFGTDYQLSVAFQLTFTVFNGFSDRAEIGRQSANYAIANENWIDTQRQTYLKVKQAFLNLEAYQQISQINQRNLKSAEEDFRLAHERYRVGAGTQLEVTDAQVSLTRARVNLVRAKYDAMISQAQLEAAMGIIEDGQ